MKYLFKAAELNWNSQQDVLWKVCQWAVYFLCVFRKYCLISTFPLSLFYLTLQNICAQIINQRFIKFTYLLGTVNPTGKKMYTGQEKILTVFYKTCRNVQLKQWLELSAFSKKFQVWAFLHCVKTALPVAVRNWLLHPTPWEGEHKEIILCR